MQKRILEISKRLGLSHIGSCTSVSSILEEIYEKKKPQDKVVCSSAHSHLAHLVVMEYYGLVDNIEEKIKHDIHCNRESGCDATGGSLGHGIGIGIGMALVDRKRDVYVITTDGGLGEGSEWEALRVKRELQLDNLHIYVNINGYTAVSIVDIPYLTERILSFCPDAQIRLTKNYKGFEGIKGHYISFNDK